MDKDKGNGKTIASKEFDAPYVRVRGRLSRDGKVRWSPCFRTGNGRDSIDDAEGAHTRSTRPSAAESQPYWVEVRDGAGKLLDRTPVQPRALAVERQWMRFHTRMRYQRDAARIVLVRDGLDVGVLDFPRVAPRFHLLAPTDAAHIDTRGIVHLHWRIDRPHGDAGKKRTPDMEQPVSFYVRYGWDGDNWSRPGVNISCDRFDLDLRDLPGGLECRAQVLATNGYHTSYVETPSFPVERKAPRLMMGEVGGPLLFAQGFSLEAGPLLGKEITWISDGRTVGNGGSFDARKLGRGIHPLEVHVTDVTGRVTIQRLGSYDGTTGLLLGANPGA